LPSHPDFLPILQNVRSKYNILEFDPDDDGIKEILLSDVNIDWQAVRQEIEVQVRSSPPNNGPADPVKTTGQAAGCAARAQARFQK
jgi:hypothetical protein